MVELLLSRLRDLAKPSIAKADVDQVAEEILRRGSGKLEAIWNDCPEQVRDDILLLCRGDVSANEIPSDRATYLVGHGLATKAGGRVKLANRLIERKAGTHRADVSSLRQSFGTRDAFDLSIRTVLELRLGAVTGADTELVRLVQRCIRHLPDDPAATLSGARDVCDRALDLIWEAEAPRGVVPKAWLDAWKEMAVTTAQKAVERFTREREIRGDDRGGQVELLRLATGRQGMKAVTARVSKAAHVLVEYTKSLGDLRNHSRAAPSVMMGAAFCMSAIELCEVLGRELHQ